MGLKCIIIEDEKIDQETLISFISRVEWLELMGTFSDATSALGFIKKNDPDFILLDIQISGISGIDFLKTLKKQHQVIVTSVSSHYVLEAFDLDVCDYLIKPVSFQRFLKAINKINRRPEALKIHEINNGNEEHTSFAFFNVSKKMVKVQFGEILFVRSMREYVSINTEKEKVITKIGISEMEEILGPGYMRVHRLFIVNIEKITAFTGDAMFLDKLQVPIGPNYRRFIKSTFGKQPQFKKYKLVK